MNYKKSKATDNSLQDAQAIAKGLQRPGQTKAETKLITQGIQKGIEQYKKQAKAKAREREKLQKKARAKAPMPDTGEVKSPVAPGANSYLPWGLLALTWLGIVAYALLPFANA